MSFVTRTIAAAPDAIAPDGSEVRLLAATERGSMAHFRLPPGAVSKPVAHRSVEEVWYFVKGRGRMWRSFGGHDEVIDAVTRRFDINSSWRQFSVPLRRR